MNSQELARFRRIEEIFDAALGYPAGAERDAFFRAQFLQHFFKLADFFMDLAAECFRPGRPLPDWGCW